MQSDRNREFDLNPADLAEVAGLAKALRADLDAAAQRTAHFWTRQQVRIRERLADRPTALRWPIAAMAALAALGFALLTVRTPAPSHTATQTETADADDLLLKDIQHSLSHRTPEALMPASVLVQEITTNSSYEQQKRDN